MPFFVFIHMNFEKPTFLINPDICKSNIRTMTQKATLSGVIFRPHFKTHQSLAIGRWFREFGITKITVSSLTAAKYFAQDGWNDITVAFPVNLREIKLINELASEVRIGLLVEHSEVVMKLNQELKFPVDIYIKIDTGYHRTGLGLNEMPEIIQLTSLIEKSPLMTLKGLITHAGQTYGAHSADKVISIYHSSTGVLNEVKQKLGKAGESLILSYGDTPSCSLVERFSNIDEIRPGNFIFYDLMQLIAGTCNFSQIGGIVVCPVVAVHPSRNQTVIYGGAIHFSKEFLALDGRRIYGQLVELDTNGWHQPIPDAWLVSLSQEHGILEAPDQVIRNLHPGMIIGVVPVHSCLTANLLQGYEMTDGEKGDYLTGI